MISSPKTKHQHLIEARPRALNLSKLKANRRHRFNRMSSLNQLGLHKTSDNEQRSSRAEIDADSKRRNMGEQMRRSLCSPLESNTPLVSNDLAADNYRDLMEIFEKSKPQLSPREVRLQM